MIEINYKNNRYSLKKEMRKLGFFLYSVTHFSECGTNSE